MRIVLNTDLPCSTQFIPKKLGLSDKKYKNNIVDFCIGIIFFGVGDRGTSINTRPKNATVGKLQTHSR
jgi:hypothetical protein